MSPQPHNDDDDLLVLRAAETPRRSDDAFARAVADDVKARRARFSFAWLLAPALAGAAAVVTVLAGSPAVPALISSETLQALAEEDARIDADVDVDGLDDATLLALLEDDGDDAPFAISTLDGSTDRELVDVEAALDRALQL
ncbi:MAG: hypothetical protein Q8O67_31130 [Deltaproteobacteria bacterium]|nr:hypothetical protein [Deltaproteobacteria bacterium]